MIIYINMNNHKKYIVNENGIEYYVFEYIIDNPKDDITIKNFVDKYEYVKLIELEGSVFYKYRNLNKPIILNISQYFRNGKIHNIYDGAILQISNNNIINKDYYIDGVNYTLNEWLVKTRKYKLTKLSNI